MGILGELMDKKVGVLGENTPAVREQVISGGGVYFSSMPRVNTGLMRSKLKQGAIMEDLGRFQTALADKLKQLIEEHGISASDGLKSLTSEQCQAIASISILESGLPNNQSTKVKLQLRDQRVVEGAGSYSQAFLEVDSSGSISLIELVGQGRATMRIEGTKLNARKDLPAIYQALLADGSKTS